MRLAINGMGRIGRQVLRIAHGRSDVDVVHVNDITDAEMLAVLLQHDTTYGRWRASVRAGDGFLEVDGRRIPASAERDPADLPWKRLEVDVVIESTGKFRSRDDAQKHLDAGARKVLISAPPKTAIDGNFVLGVNDDRYEPDRHRVVSIGSCTTNALAPLAKVLHEELGIVRGLMTTVHAYTASQNLLDGPHRDPRRARAAAENIVPTTTGAAGAIGDVIPDLDGRMDGMAIRVPVKCGSIVDLTCEVERSTESKEVNDLLRKWAAEPMKGILQVTDEPLVSSDIVGHSASAVVPAQDTRVMHETLVKVFAWYDNEWGFSTRLVDMVERMV